MNNPLLDGKCIKGIVNEKYQNEKKYDKYQRPEFQQMPNKPKMIELI